MRLALLCAAVVFSGCGSSASSSAAPPAPESGPLVQLRLVQDEPAPGLEAREVDGEKLYLEPEILASDDDLSRPRLVSDDGEWTLDLRFTVDGGVALDRALLDRAGSRLALIVDSEVRDLITARPQIGASRMLVDLDVSDAEAARLQEAIDSRWP